MGRGGAPDARAHGTAEAGRDWPAGRRYPSPIARRPSPRRPLPRRPPLSSPRNTGTCSAQTLSTRAAAGHRCRVLTAAAVYGHHCSSRSLAEQVQGSHGARCVPVPAHSIFIRCFAAAPHRTWADDQRESVLAAAEQSIVDVHGLGQSIPSSRSRTYQMGCPWHFSTEKNLKTNPSPRRHWRADICLPWQSPRRRERPEALRP